MATLTRAESLAILSGGAKGKSTPALEQDEETRRSSQNSDGAVMSREVSLKILSEGAAGTYKPKNETVSNSPSTAGLADMFTPFGAAKDSREKLQKELDRLDNAAAYVTTTEQSDEIDAQRKPIIEQLRKLDEAEGKTGVYTGGDRLKNALGNVKLTTQQGLTQADHRIAQTADWLFGGIAKEGKALVNATLQTINPNWGFEDEDPLISKYNKRGTEVLAQNDAVAQQRIEEGKLNKTAWKYAPEVVAAIPDAVLAFATGGASTGAQATRAGLETASAIAQGSRAAQKLIPIADAAKDMMKSPAWMSAFAQTAGGSYEEALADGATEEQASLYALLNGFANATIEVGGSDEAMGGIQKLPQQLRDALEKGNKSAVMQWVKSTAGEAKEEVLQGMAEKGLRGLYTNDVPLYSATDENAVINPKRAKEEALGGLIVGGVLGGGQTVLQSAVNSGRGQNANGAQNAQETQTAAGDISAPPTQANADTGASARLNSDVQAGADVQNAEGIKNAASRAANADIAGDSRVANAEASRSTSETSGANSPAINAEDVQTADANAWRVTSETKNALSPAAEADASNANIAPEAQNVNPSDDYDTGRYNRAARAESQGKRIRGFSENVATDEAMNEDLRESHRESPDTYEPLANKDVLAKANAIYAEGFDSARSKLQQAIGAAKSGQTLAPEMLPLGRMVANELAKTDLKAAREITSDLAVELTKAGQFIQAAKLLRQTGASPLDVMETIAKGLAEINKAVADKYPRKAAKWEAALTEAEIKQIQNTDFKQDGAFESVYEQVMKRVGEEMPAGLWEKLTEIRRISMLLNPKTQFKNIAANIPMMGMRKVSEKLSGAIQDGLTAVGWMDKAEQTRTSYVSDAKKELARRVYDEVKDDIKGQSNKWDMRQDINKYRTYFKKGAIQKFIERKVGKEMQHSVLESTRQLTYELLETGDAPFVKSAFVDSLAQYCAAQGIHNRADVTQAAIDFATANAMEATFKNANAIATALNNLKRNSSAASAALDVLLPFTTTPANIMQLTLDYSPLGFIKAAGSKIEGKSTKAQRIDMISKATTGSALMALGFAARAIGAITGAEPDDEDEAEWLKANGWQAYSFRGEDGDWYYAYDWAQPVGSMLVFGSEIYDAIQGREDWRDAVFNAVYASGDSALNMSLFQNILGVLKGTGSPTEKVLEEIVTGGATQFMPGIAGAIARTIDGTKRSSYTGGDVIDDTKAQLQANTPFASKKLPASVNVKGEENTRGNTWERILQNFISPGNFSKGEGKKTDVDKEIESLYAETEDNSIFPRKSPYKVSYDGETYTFTGDERAGFQKIQGSKYYELASKLIASDIYRNASGYDRAKMLAEISSFSLDAAKRDFFKDKDGVEYSSDKYDSIYESGTKNVWEYLGAKTAFTQAKKQNDYTAQDKFLEVYDQLTAGTKRMLENSSATARMDDMAEAYEKGGIRSQDWNAVYEKYKELNGTKRSGYTASDRATDFEAWMEREGFTKNQRKILTDQFTFFSQVPGDAGRYNSLKDAGFDTDSAYAIYDKVSSLTAPTGEKTVKDWQKLEAINSLDLTGEEKIKALSVYYPPNDDGKEDAMVRRYKAAEEQGISFATWTKAMKIIAGADGTSRKAIFAAVQDAGYTETDAQIIYDIWKHS